MPDWLACDANRLCSSVGASGSAKVELSRRAENESPIESPGRVLLVPLWDRIELNMLSNGLELRKNEFSFCVLKDDIPGGLAGFESELKEKSLMAFVFVATAEPEVDPLASVETVSDRGEAEEGPEV